MDENRLSSPRLKLHSCLPYCLARASGTPSVVGLKESVTPRPDVRSVNQQADPLPTRRCGRLKAGRPSCGWRDGQVARTRQEEPTLHPTDKVPHRPGAGYGLNPGDLEERLPSVGVAHRPAAADTLGVLACGTGERGLPGEPARPAPVSGRQLCHHALPTPRNERLYVANPASVRVPFKLGCLSPLRDAGGGGGGGGAPPPPPPHETTREKRTRRGGKK
jgi:hypothetical protein